MYDALFAFALLCVAWGIVSSIRIVSYLSERGVKINWLLIRLMIIKYASQYEELTRKETGKPGWWFYSYVVSMNLALVSGVLGIILKLVL